MTLLTIKVSRESVSFEVSDPSGKLTSEAALAMAEINARWGYRGSIEDLRAEHLRVIKRSTALTEGTTKTEASSEIDAMLHGSNKIAIMEGLAASFRESRDDPQDEGPEFMETDDPEGILRDYAASLGCAVEIL